MKRCIIYKIVFLLCLLLSMTGNVKAQSCPCGIIQGPDVLTNQDFEYPCNTNPLPFYSGMVGTCSGSSWEILNHSNGMYGIGVATQFQSQWQNPGAFSGSKYFVGDGPWGPSGPGNVKAWQQFIPVVAGQTYLFSAWYMYQEGGSQPTMALTVKYSVLKYNNNTVPPLQWKKFCAVYTATATETIEVGVLVYKANASNQGGADFGLDKIEFIPFNPFLAVPASDQSICKGQSVNISANTPLNGSGNYTYTWSNGATGQTINVTPDQTTEYQVTITDLTSGCVVYDWITVTVIDLQVSLGEDIGICPTNPNVTINADVTGGSGNYTYLWNTGATTSSIVANYNSPGTFSVTVTDNVHGCVATDAVIAYKAVCTGDKYYQNNNNLPAMTHFNRIFAGYNVTGSPTYGNVVVQNGQNVTFRGGSSVHLAPGFSAQPGGLFNAYITPGCYLNAVTIKKTNEGFCAFTLKAIVGVGSGSYSYLWNTGATTSSIFVIPLTTTTYSVTVTDICLGGSVNVPITITPHYRGDVTYTTFPNLITPNGNGLNDIFVLEDGGKTEYAFNAYEYYLAIYNRWGSQVWSKWNRAQPNSTGFAEGEIYWNPNSPYVSDGVYYAYLELTNCDHFKYEVNGWVEVLRSGQKMTVNPVDSPVSDSTVVARVAENSAFKIFPNPANDQLFINTPNGKSYSEIRIMDIYGVERKRILYSAQTSSGISITDLPEGLYLIEVLLPDEEKYVTKFYKKAQ